MPALGDGACEACRLLPAMSCGRCATTRCVAHALRPGQRCEACEADWDGDAVSRRAAKLMFTPAAALLVGGMTFLLGLPLVGLLGGLLGAALVSSLACATGALTAVGVSRFVDRSARALFLREHARQLPPARALPPGR